MELAAIWLDGKVIVETEDNKLKSTLRIEKGQHLRILHGTILDVEADKPANFTVSKCMGNATSSQLELHLIGNNAQEYKLVLK
jgi:hypothetical protein